MQNPSLARHFSSSKKRKGPWPKKQKAPKSSGQKLSERKIMPALLTATASQHVYVAKTALDETIDPLSLFSEGQTIPPLLANCDFEYQSPKSLKHEFPRYGTPEVAFLGRSNVGKSSLINSILRRNLCLTSKNPGRTQLPYYYGLFSKHNSDRAPASAKGFIIDLPGYGFAAAPKDKVEAWQADTQDLLINRRETGVLKRLFLLLDARRDELTEMDRTVMTWLEDAEIPYSVVLTKTDRISKPIVIKLVNELCMRYASLTALEGEDGYACQSPVIHTTSSKRNWGIHELMLSVETEFVGDDDDDDYDGDSEEEDL
jgi:GTP-binding protein